MDSTVLLNVGTEYAEPLESWCEAASHRVVRAEEFSAPTRCVLAVVQVSEGDAESLELVQAVRKRLPLTPAIVLADRIKGRTAFLLARLGIEELIDLPAAPEDVVAAVAGCVRPISANSTDSGEFIGATQPADHLRREIATAAPVDTTVLLQGETGTGKGLIAKLIHESSPRRDGPLIHVDCAALAPTLVESELFGHEKGAFTGAQTRRIGRFEAAAKGTIFLDEIGDLDPSLQPKLLRVLQDRVYERVGDTKPLRMQARVIAATSRDLARSVEEGRFRRDLYYRLNVFRIDIPPLRQRVDDIPLLARWALRSLSKRLSLPSSKLSEAAYERLAEHTWPGNVRELFHVLEAALVRSTVDTIDGEDLRIRFSELALTDEPASPTPPLNLSWTEWVAGALDAEGGNVRRAAERLGIARTTLRRRIQELDLEHLTRSQRGRPSRDER